MAEQNPSARPEDGKAPERKRVPMTTAQRRLQIPDKPGFKRHWFTDQNVERALQAGYEFVKRDDVHVNQRNVANSKTIDGNADLGSNVRVVGGKAENGGVEYLTLMEIREEWWKEDHAEIERRNAQVLSAIFTQEQVMGVETHAAEDRALNYVDRERALFQRPRRKV